MAADYFGRPAALQDKRLWLFDMDGTIYMENRLFDGTLPLLAEIRRRGGRAVYITNNSSRSVRAYVDKLDGMGIRVGEEDFFTSAQATVRMLRRDYSGAKVYCQGTRSLIDELRRGGVDVTEQVERVDVVLLGFDLELTSEKLRRTCQILTEQDPAYFATNPDLVCPVSFGYVPDCGSISVMIRNATGKYPRFIGKPEPAMVQIAMEKFGCTPEQTLVIGDRLYTDVAAGVNAGADTILVLSGEATLADLEKSPVKPSWVFRDVQAIYESLREQ